MVHPMNGETISSNKKLMHNPVSFEIWKTAFGKDFGKDFGRMAQGNNKTKQNGTTLIFLMTHKEIKCIPKN